jgi:hypothetical protein
MRLAAICLTALAIASNVAYSQDNNPMLPAPAQPTTTGTAWRAPVGHRQPTMSDLPPDVAQREMNPGGTTSEARQRASDSRLTICRGC